FTVYIFFIYERNERSLRANDEIAIETSKTRHYFDEQKWNELNHASLEGGFEERRDSEKLFANNVTNQTWFTFEIWSKAAIGVYLWEHILKGAVDKRADREFYVHGFKKIGNFKIKFRSGPSLNVASLRQYLTNEAKIKNFLSSKSKTVTKNIVLVINGRDEDKVKYSKSYLNELMSLRNDHNADRFQIGLVMLGNENCFNNWIKPYLEKYGGIAKFLFIVYDWNAIDNESIFQWPLGVATYRNFPNLNSNNHFSLKSYRPYFCNFLGSIYKNSSREELYNLLKKLNLSEKCLIKPRWEWQPIESPESMQFYVEALKTSDLTLSPIGMNHECYRIYEAMTYGSVPILEENLNHVRGKRSMCDQKSAYRLLKSDNSPLIFIKNWTLEFPLLLRRENELSLEAKIERRINLVNWYNRFKVKLRDQFLNVIREKFFMIQQE
ncbi:hypothetical protein B4U79_03160, partial [Dinothrombium tinctorium]